jgi:4-amino-4-deoxy-L-arabinose transferase-like glycosyltransferase
VSNTSLASLKEEFAAETEAAARVAREPGARAALGLLLLLVLFHVAANLWWLRADNHTIRTDEEGHMYFARQYHETLFVMDYPDPVRRLIAVSHIRPGIPAHPPLFHLLGALMIQVFGYSTDTMAATSTVLFVLLLLGCYALARTFLRPWQSLFVVFVVSFTPMVFAASRYFMTDYGSAAIAVWAIYALIQSDGFQRPGWVFFFGVLNGLGILTRTVTFAYFLLPAVAVVLFGLWRIVRNRPNDFGRGTLSGLVLNTVMALTVTAGIFGPWYYANLEPFYDYWANKEISGSRGPLTRLVPAPVAPSGASNTSVAGQSADPGPRYAAVATAIEEKLKDPPVAWVRYPVYVVNNGLFLPLSVCSLLGMLTAFLVGQFRCRTVVLLLLWVLGSWFFFSVLIRSGTARYAVPVAPALALFAAVFVLALPGRWIRVVAGSVLGAVLLFQYGNLTFSSYGPIARVASPIAVPAAEARHFVDQNLMVYKDSLSLGFSYARLGAPETEDFKERLIRAMLDHEKSLPVRAGRYANYQKLNLRGMELHERHFWPGENPYRLASLGAEDSPDRTLQMIHMGTAPEHLLPKLGETDYIVYQSDASTPAVADGYEEYFGKRGFIPITRFDVAGYGWVPATTNGVLARQLDGELVPVTAESIGGMDLYDLHELKYSADFALLAPALQSLVRETFQAKLASVATPYQLNDSVTFMSADVSRVDAQTYRFRLVFQVHKALDRDWRMFFHGYVDPENLNALPPEKQEQGYVDWNFDPRPPATTWVPGDYVVLTHEIQAAPLAYEMVFGLFQGETLFGRMGRLKRMDLAAIP